MEFLSCGFEGRALLFADDLDFAVDGLTRSRNLLKNWNEKDVVESIGFVEPLLPDTIRSTSFLDDQLLESNGHKTKDHSPTPTNIANDEKFGTAKQSKGNLFSVDNSVLPAPSAKRVKIGDLQPPIPTCQVHGCNKDLSASKDYHKRHKVCNAHSKTGVVIVNGIRQRFCQQCSRFHVLSEFDEDKRSCRKRLAGHNERRRKPQFNTHFRDASKALILSRILSSGFFECNQPSNASRSLKQEEEPLALRKTVLRFHGMGKEYPSKNCLNAPSSLLELYAGSASGCALSLLSARKHKLLSNSQGMSMAHSLIPAGNDHSNLSTAQSSSSTAVGLEVTRGANTVNLLELSLHLQRVEQQKYHGQIKMEDGNFFDSSIV